MGGMRGGMGAVGLSMLLVEPRVTAEVLGSASAAGSCARALSGTEAWLDENCSKSVVPGDVGLLLAGFGRLEFDVCLASLFRG